MQPSSHQTGQGYSPRANAARSTSAHPEPHRVRVRPDRPEKYEVPPAPRRVISAELPETSDDSVSTRTKARRRLRLRRRLTAWEWAGFATSCVACAFLLPMIVRAESDFRHLRGQVGEKQEQLSSLDRQKTEEKNRLAHLKSPSGREQLLAERGYLKPGTRILLFPEDRKQ